MELLSRISKTLVHKTNSRGTRYFVVLCAFLVLCSLCALAQDATIVGTVTDPSGSVVPNATITITAAATGQARTQQTNEVGQYVANSVAIGSYTVKAQAKGFKTTEKTGVTLNVGDRQRLDFVLAVGAENTTVTVEANAIAVQADTSEISSVVTGKQITSLTTNGRSLYALVNLTPGASSLQTDFQVPTPMGGDGAVSFNGQRVSHNLYIINGGEAADRGGSGAIVMPSLEGLAEFRTMTSNYSAEFGLSSAGTVTMVTKSGSKAFHGSGWEFNRNDYFQARNYFNPHFKPCAVNGTGCPAGQSLTNTMPKQRMNIYGFNIGGPVKFHSGGDPKTFFFYNMEWRKQRQGSSFNRVVPYPSTYGGNMQAVADFSAANPSSTLYGNTGFPGILLPCGSGGNAVSTGAGSVTAKFAAAGYGTLNTCGANGLPTVAANALYFSGTPGVATTLTDPARVAGFIIPSTLISPNATALLTAGIFPAPTNANAYQSSAVSAPTDVREEMVRVDHSFGDKLSIFGSWIQEKILQTDVPERWSGANVPTSSDTFGNPSRQGVVHLTHNIRPTLLNEIAFNYDSNRIAITPIGVTTAAGFTNNRLFTVTATDTLPIIALNGKTGAQFNHNWSPWNNTADDYQFRDDLSLTKGSHQIKIGGSWAKFMKLQPLQVSPQGNFGFNGQFTNNDFSDFLLGLASGYNEAVTKDSRQWNSTSLAIYFQDNWRATSRLTLNLGLRWDGIPHTYEANGNMSTFIPSLYNPLNRPTGGTGLLADPVNHPLLTDPLHWGSGNQLFADAAGTQVCNGPDIPHLSGCTAASGGIGTGTLVPGFVQYNNGISLPGQNGVTNGLVNNHWANFGPRLGFAYDFSGNGKTIIRGGFGAMFERIQGNDMYQTASNNLVGGSVAINNVSLENQHTGIDSNNLIISTANLPNTVNSITFLDSKRYKNPTTYQYNLGVQHQFGPQTVLSLSYVGNQSHNQSNVREINMPFRGINGIGDGSDQGQLKETVLAGINPNYSAATPYTFNVKYKGFKSVRLYENNVNGHYNGFQAELRSQLKQGITFHAGYTFSKAIDPATGTGGDGWDLNTISNPYKNWQYDQGNGVFDRRQILFIDMIYELPFFKNSSNHMAKSILGGWQMSATGTVQTGAPINVGVSGSNICGTVQNCAVRPNLTGATAYLKTPAILGSGLQTKQWLNPYSVTAQPYAGTSGNAEVADFGNLPRNYFYGPGRNNWNMSLSKTFSFTERVKLEMRAESFNVFNHTEFIGNTNQGGVNNTVPVVGAPTSNSFGMLTSAFAARDFQVGGRITF